VSKFAKLQVFRHIELPFQNKTKAKAPASAPTEVKVAPKNAFEANFGEGTAFNLDYGKLVIIALLIYVAYQVS